MYTICAIYTYLVEEWVARFAPPVRNHPVIPPQVAQPDALALNLQRGTEPGPPLKRKRRARVVGLVGARGHTRQSINKKIRMVHAARCVLARPGARKKNENKRLIGHPRTRVHTDRHRIHVTSSQSVLFE